ncbi:hypothetical protein HGA34_05410 [Candidatus Falkowbacteria bacterium]|nr:hypothetical protein [Candidatus Falkowbacteria bacterium]
MKKIITATLILATLILANLALADGCQPGDTIAPKPIVDFKVRPLGLNKAELTWSVPEDQSDIASYEVRYRTNVPLNSLNWATATKMTGTPTPRKVQLPDSPVAKTITGYAENMVINIPAGTSIYFGIRATDSCGKASNLSNVPQLNNPFTVPATNVITMDPVNLAALTTVTSTVYLNNASNLAGYSMLVVYDPAKLAIANIQSTSKPNALPGLFDSNLDFTGPNMQEHLAKLVSAYEAAGKRVAIVVAATTENSTGKIPLFDITLAGISPGTTSLMFIPENASWLNWSAQTFPADLSPYPAPFISQITVQ